MAKSPGGENDTNHDPQTGHRSRPNPWDNDSHEDMLARMRAERDGIRRMREEGDETRRGRRVGLSGTMRLFLFLVGLGLLLFSLSKLFPETAFDDPYLIRALVILFIFGGAAVFWSRTGILKLLRMAGIWALFIAGASMFYLYQSDLGYRFMSALSPSSAVVTDEGMIFHRNQDGHFWVDASFNGTNLTMLVDTGATAVVLSPDDARRIGIDIRDLDFTGKARTANGVVRFAPTTIREIQVGDQFFYNVPVNVNEAEMSGSLLGMSLLDRFSGFEKRGNQLIIRP